MLGNFTGWKKVELIQGELILELRLIPYGPAKAFLRKVNGLVLAMKALKEDEDRDLESFLGGVEGSLEDEWLRDVCFANYVRTGAKGEDGKPAADGALVFDELGIGMILSIVYKLSELAQLSAREGKASRSSSPSTTEATPPPASASDATSTEPGDGRTP